MPNLMPKGLGLMLRCMCAKSHPDSDASSAAMRNITTM